MNKKNQIYVSLFTVILMLFSQILMPITSLGATKGTQNNDGPLELYFTTEVVTLDEGFTISEETYLYADKDQNGVRVQYGDTYITIPFDTVEKMSTDSEVKAPTFVDESNYSVKNSMILPKESSLYSTIPNENARIILNDEIEYPLYENELGLEVIYLGNVEFYFSQEDRIIALEEFNDSEESDTPEINDGNDHIDDESNSDEEVISEEDSMDDDSNNDSDDVGTEIKNNLEDEDLDEVEKDSRSSEQDIIDEEDIKANFLSQNIAPLSVPDPWQGVSSAYFRVTKDDAIVYDNRGNGSLKPIGSLKKDQVYPRISDYGNWHRIQYGDIYGYVKKSDTLPNNGKILKNKNSGYKNQSRTFKALKNVEVYDSTSGSLVPYGIINQNQTYPIATDYGNWWRVLYADRVGYVRKSEVEIQFTSNDKYFKADSNVEVYDNRGNGILKKVGELEKGQVYPRVSDYGNWHRIQFGNIYGYVRKSETSYASRSEIKNLNTTYKHHSRTFTALNSVTVYDNTSGSLVPFGKIDKGETFPIATNFGNWWRVIYADRVGYIKKTEVKVQIRNTDQYFRVFKNLPVYDNRTGSLIKVGELKAGQSYPIVSDYGNWWRVQFGDIYGYVRKADTGYAMNGEIPNLNQSYRNTKDKIVASANVTVYDNSGSGGLVPFGQLDEGTIYPIASNYGSWWRIVYLDRVGYVRKSEVDQYGASETNYNITLRNAVNKQMTVSPQTDIYNGGVYVHWSAFESHNEKTMTGVLKRGFNVRTGPSTNYHSLYLTTGTRNVKLIEETREGDGAKWWKITRASLPTWINAPRNDVEYNMNPNNFINDARQQLQFLDLTKSSGAAAADLNKVLVKNGVLHGKGSKFVEASNKYNVNEVYLVAHAKLETGNGNSELAKGISRWTKRDAKGNIVRDNKNNPVIMDISPRKVYNMYGIGAFDNCARDCGAQRAYDRGWFSVDTAIIEGAQFIGQGYVNAGQNTLYKMRWNPAALVNGNPTHQYATDIRWASKQTRTIYELYQQIDSYTLFLDIPVYKK